MPEDADTAVVSVAPDGGRVLWEHGEPSEGGIAGGRPPTVCGGRAEGGPAAAKDGPSPAPALEPLSAEALLAWFAVHRRRLPWRENRDPYRVWIAEVMLQQTRVETAIPYYQRFLEQFPTVHALAEAPEAAVLKAWEGLGYYSRARNLQRAAREVVARYGGTLPADARALAALPGIGPYTAGAIAALAFNLPVAAVDGNVLRVMARALGIPEDVSRPAVQRRIAAAVESLIPPGRAGLFVEALMELGALVCTPKSPQCTACPWQRACVAHGTGQAERLPRRAPRTRPRPVYGAVAVIARGERVLVVRRPAEGLLAGLWEFPWAEAAREEDASPALVQAVARELGLEVQVERELVPVRHVFSHLEWRLRVYACRWLGDAADQPGRTAVQTGMAPADHAGGEGDRGRGRDSTQDPALTPERLWASREELARLAFGRAHRRIGQLWLAAGRTAPGGGAAP
ncbi:MAG TPA: A/G-specific adenine glycosylase [Limnochordales bacterium]